MKRKIIATILYLTFLCTFSYANGTLQNEDFKSLSDIESAVLVTTGNLSISSHCISSPASVAGLVVGVFVYDTSTPSNIPSNTTIAGLPGTCSAGQIQMSNAATSNATGDTLSFGGQMSQLLNDTKIYISALGIDTTLAQAIINGSIGGGGGGSTNTNASPVLQSVEQKFEAEHVGVFTDPFDKSVGSGFVKQNGSYYVNGALMGAVSSGGSVVVPVWEPVVLNSSDKNTSTTSNWSTDTNSTSLTTSSTTMVGSTSVSATKTTGGTTSLIKYSSSSANKSVVNNTDLWFWINLSSATGVNSIEVVVDIDGTNSELFSTTTNYAGGALVNGWNLININLSSTGTPVGSGWAPNQPFQYFHVGLVTASSGTTPTYLINGIFFSLANAFQYLPPGAAITLYDNVNRESNNLDASNSIISGGGIALTSALSHSYVGGFGSTSVVLSRSTLSVANGQAAMTTSDQFGNSLSGNIELSQESRLSTVLRSPLTSNTLNAFADINTPQVYPVVSTTSTQIVMQDVSNQSGDLLSGESVHVFRTIYSDGKKNFIYRGDMVLSTNSSNTGGQTTLTCTGLGCVPSGTQAGDYVVKKQTTFSYSAVNLGQNEAFSAMSPVSSPDGIILYDSGSVLPNQNNVQALYSLGMPNANLNQFGSLSSLSVTGTLSQNSPFKNGQYSTSGWSDSNYLTVNGNTVVVESPSSMFISLWWYVTNTNGTYAISDQDPGNTIGWAVTMYGGNNSPAIFVNGNPYCNNTVSVATGQWHHFVVNYQSGVSGGSNIYMDGSLIDTCTVPAITASGNGVIIGTNNGLTNSLAANDRLAQLLIGTGNVLSSSQVLQIYNNGQSVILGFGPRLKYRFQQIHVSGQLLSIDGQLSRDTTGVMPFFGKMGILQVP